MKDTLSAFMTYYSSHLQCDDKELDKVILNHNLKPVVFPYNMQPDIKLGELDSGDSLKVLRPFENVDKYPTDMRCVGEHNDKQDEYVSQQHLIKKRMLGSSLTADLYPSAMTRFQDLIHSQYGDDNYSEGWTKWRAESLLWDYYFSPEPFPGTRPPKTPLVIVSPRISNDPTTKKPSIVEASQIQADTRSATRRNFDHRRTYHRSPDHGSFKHRSSDQQNIDRRNSDRRKSDRRSPDSFTPHHRSTERYRSGLKYQTDSYRQPQEQKDQYRLTPVKQSGFLQAIKNEKENSVQRSTRRVSNGAVGLTRADKLGSNESSTKLVPQSVTHANSNVLPIRMHSAFQSAPPPQTALPHPINYVHNAGSFAEPIQLYQSMERLMEKKAIVLGIRQQFFRVLQKKRDLANLVHRDCSRQYKHWFAYSSTWSTLFTTPYPGIEPMGKDVHAENCRPTEPINSPVPSPSSIKRALTLVILPVPGDSDSCWKEYADKHNSTDLDHLLIEEQAKREGELRMVLDDVTGEVVNLKLFAARSGQRALQRLASLPVGETDVEIQDFERTICQSSSQKRKFEALEEGEIVEKKPRTDI